MHTKQLKNKQTFEGGDLNPLPYKYQNMLIMLQNYWMIPSILLWCKSKTTENTVQNSSIMNNPLHGQQRQKRPHTLMCILFILINQKNTKHKTKQSDNDPTRGIFDDKYIELN